MPGGGFSSADGRWHTADRAFFLPVRALSPIFRAKFRDAMHAAGLLAEIDAKVWSLDWNVNCQPVALAAHEDQAPAGIGREPENSDPAWCQQQELLAHGTDSGDTASVEQ